MLPSVWSVSFTEPAFIYKTRRAYERDIGVFQSQRAQRRIGNYERAEKISSTWRPSTNYLDPITLAETTDTVRFDEATASFLQNLMNHLPTLRRTIGSSLLSYRLLCLFEFEECPPIKRNETAILGAWSVMLEFHGKRAVFYDRFGAADVRFEDGAHEDQQWMEHVRELLGLLCSAECPHPYDGTVAGCVA